MLLCGQTGKNKGEGGEVNEVYCIKVVLPRWYIHEAMQAAGNVCHEQWTVIIISGRYRIIPIVLMHFLASYETLN